MHRLCFIAGRMTWPVGTASILFWLTIGCGSTPEEPIDPPEKAPQDHRTSSVRPPEWFQNRSFEDQDFRYFEARGEGSTQVDAERNAVVYARTEASQSIVVRIRSALESRNQENTRGDQSELRTDVDEKIDLISESLVPNTTIEKRTSLPDGQGGFLGFARLKVPRSAFEINLGWYQARAQEAIQRNDFASAEFWYEAGIQSLEDDRVLREGMIDVLVQQGKLAEGFFEARDLGRETNEEKDLTRARELAERWANATEKREDLASTCEALKALLDPTLGANNRERISDRLARTFQRRAIDAEAKANYASAVTWLREGLPYATDDDTRMAFQASITSLDRRRRDLFQQGVDRLVAGAKRAENPDTFSLGGTSKTDVRLDQAEFAQFSAETDQAYFYYAIWIESKGLWVTDFFADYQQQRLIANGGPRLFELRFTSDSAKGSGTFIGLAAKERLEFFSEQSFEREWVNDPARENRVADEAPQAERFDSLIESVVQAMESGDVYAISFPFRLL